MYRSWPLIASSAAIAALATSFLATAANVSFLPLGLDVRVNDVSHDGSTIVGFTHAVGLENPQEAFLWQLGEEKLLLGKEPYKWTEASSVSGDGKVVAGIAKGKDPDSGYHDFLWTKGSGMQLDGWVPPVVAALSFDGTVAVGTSLNASEGDFAYRWTLGTGTVSLGHLPDGVAASQATDVSADGTIVIGNSGDPVRYPYTAPFRWSSEDGMVKLPALMPNRPWGSTRAISPDGSATIGFSGAAAVVWTGSEVVSLGRLADEVGVPIPQDVSNGGKVIVGAQGPNLSETAFRWTEKTGMKPLASLLAMGGIDMSGWHLQSARHVSSDGSVIVGVAIDAFGYYRDYVAVVPVDFVPEPNSAWLFAGAICSLAFYRRKNCSWKSGGYSSDRRQ